MIFEIFLFVVLAATFVLGVIVGALLASAEEYRHHKRRMGYVDVREIR